MCYCGPRRAHREPLGMVKAKMKVKLNFDVEDLKAEIQRVWDSIPQQQIDELVMSYPRRVQKMLESGGEDCQLCPFKKLHFSFPGGAFVVWGAKNSVFWRSFGPAFQKSPCHQKWTAHCVAKR